MKSFQSVFNREMEEFLDTYPHNKAEQSRRSHLRSFDTFLAERDVKNGEFAEEHIWRWISQQKGKRHLTRAYREKKQKSATNLTQNTA